jgi:hypothetical protein
LDVREGMCHSCRRIASLTTIIQSIPDHVQTHSLGFGRQ